MNGVLRNRVTGRQPTGFRPDQLSEFVVVMQCAGAYGIRIEPFGESQIMKNSCRMRQEVDPDAKRLQFGNRFENSNFATLPMQHQRENQSDRPRPGDQNGFTHAP